MIYESSLKHHGILGMKWGVRRYQPYPSGHKGGKEIGKAALSRKQKRELKKERKKVARSIYGKEVVRTAVLSKISESDYKKAARALSQGKLAVNAKFKENYGEKSIDLFLGKQVTPTMRIRIDEGHNYIADFLNKDDANRYNQFVNYYNERY